MLAIGPSGIRFGMLILGAVANPLLAILIPDENLTVVINSAPGENPVLASVNHAGKDGLPGGSWRGLYVVRLCRKFAAKTLNAIQDASLLYFIFLIGDSTVIM